MNLTGKQQRAAALLAIGTSKTDTARTVECHPNTITRWLKLEDFAALVQAITDDAVELTKRLHRRSSEKALTIVERMKIPDVVEYDPNVVLRVVTSETVSRGTVRHSEPIQEEGKDLATILKQANKLRAERTR